MILHGNVSLKTQPKLCEIAVCTGTVLVTIKNVWYYCTEHVTRVRLTGK